MSDITLVVALIVINKKSLSESIWNNTVFSQLSIKRIFNSCDKFIF